VVARPEALDLVRYLQALDRTMPAVARRGIAASAEGAPVTSSVRTQ
jgi:hypothetical protein